MSFIESQNLLPEKFSPQYFRFFIIFFIAPREASFFHHEHKHSRTYTALVLTSQMQIFFCSCSSRGNFLEIYFPILCDYILKQKKGEKSFKRKREKEKLHRKGKLFMCFYFTLNFLQMILFDLYFFLLRFFLQPERNRIVKRKIEIQLLSPAISPLPFFNFQLRFHDTEDEKIQ